MPRRKRIWSAWNVFGSATGEAGHQVSLTYYLNRLQKLTTLRDYFVTLNPHRAVRDALVELNYAHPRFDFAAIRAQRDLPELQGHGGVYFAGAWSRYGFHEDGILSAVRVAALLGVTPPWGTS